MCKSQNTEGEKSSKIIQLAVLYDIDFIADDIIPHVVEGGSAIELSCEIDEYPEGLVIIWKKKLDQWNRESKLAMGPDILNGDSRASVKIEKDGDHKVGIYESILIVKCNNIFKLRNKHIQKNQQKKSKQRNILNLTFISCIL